MSTDYWQKQTDTPLFENILWSRPQSKAGAGKLVVVGGNSHGFGAPGIAYNTALDSGVGVCRVVLPDAIKKIVKGMLPDADFVPSTPSGSFSRNALDTILSDANWSDLCLLAGDIGRNSETAILLEIFVQKYTGLLTITQDAIDYFKETPLQIVDRENTLIALSLSQLQKIFIATPTITPITFSMTSQQLAHALHDYTQIHPACIITKHNDLLFVAFDGKVATQKHDEKIWRIETAARASVFWLQNPSNIFEAAVSAMWPDTLES